MQNSSNNGHTANDIANSRDGTYAVNRSLYITNLRRFWPGAALLLLIFLIIALIMFVDLAGRIDYLYNYSGAVNPEYVTSTAFYFTSILAMFAGIISSMLCFRYLMNHREAIMAHSLPIKRESHLITAAASGITLLGAPIIIGGFLFYVSQAVFGFFFPLEAMFWTFSTLAIAVFYFGITSFFSMVSGNSIAHGLLTLIFVNLPIMIEAVFMNYCSRFWFGFVEWEYLSTKINPFYHVFIFISDTIGNYTHSRGTNFLAPSLFLLIGIAFLALAGLIYKRRKIETAGDVITFRQVRPFFRYGVALGFAFLFGMIYYGMASGLRYSPVWEIVFSIIGGAFGFFVAEMFIRRTIHVFKRHYMGAVGFSLVFIAVFLLIYNDVPGYGRMQLDADLIDYIVIDNMSQRVASSINGDPLNYYGTMADLDIDDPGGYLIGRRYESSREVLGPIPPGIAKQILEQDTTVLRGENAKAAVALQNNVADNARRFSSNLPDAIHGQSYNYDRYNYDHLSVVACYKNGRIIKRDYAIRLFRDDEFSSYETPESVFRRLQFNVRRINQDAVRRYYTNCAARAEYVTLEFYVSVNDEIIPTYVYGDYAATNNDRKTTVLSQGEWAGLFEAYELDGIEQNVADSITSYSYGSRYNGVSTLVRADIHMPDGYVTYVNMALQDRNVAEWLIHRGYVDASVLATTGAY